MRQFFEHFDLLMTPTTPVAAFDLGRDVPPELDGANIVAWVAYTYPFNLCGLPAASVPCGFTRAGLPVGLHIVAKALARDGHSARGRGLRGGAAMGRQEATRKTCDTTNRCRARRKRRKE